jgi:lipid A 4'-phosphatase
MLKLKKFLTIVLIISFVDTSSVYARSRDSALRSFGDYAQVINPVIVSFMASKEKGFGHFAIIYAQSWATTHSVKFISNQTKWASSKRPFILNKQDRYDGMPSGHTNSAWVAAAYVRTFSEEYKFAAIPLYVSAAITGYSRVYAKEHTVSQVIAGAAIAELITYINSKLKWSNEYRSASFYFGNNQAHAGIRLQF